MVPEILGIDQLLADLGKAVVKEEFDDVVVSQALLEGQAHQAFEELHPLQQDRQRLLLRQKRRHERGGYALVPGLLVQGFAVDWVLMSLSHLNRLIIFVGHIPALNHSQILCGAGNWSFLVR